MTLEELEKRIKILELVNDGALPATSLGALLSTLALGFTFFLGVSAVGATGVYIARKYAKNNKDEIKRDLNTFRRNGELTEKRYRELIAILNKLTVE